MSDAGGGGLAGTEDVVVPAARATTVRDDAADDVTRPRTGGTTGERRSGPGKKLLVYLALVAFSVIYIYPFLIQLATSFKTDQDAVANALSLVPDPLTDPLPLAGAVPETTNAPCMPPLTWNRQ